MKSPGKNTLRYLPPSRDLSVEAKPFIEKGPRNFQRFFSGMKAPDDFNTGWGNSEFPGQKTDQNLIRLSFNRRGSHFHLDPVPIGANHFIPGRLGLKIDL